MTISTLPKATFLGLHFDLPGFWNVKLLTEAWYSFILTLSSSLEHQSHSKLTLIQTYGDHHHHHHVDSSQGFAFSLAYWPQLAVSNARGCNKYDSVQELWSLPNIKSPPAPRSLAQPAADLITHLYTLNLFTKREKKIEERREKAFYFDYSHIQHVI